MQTAETKLSRENAASQAEDFLQTVAPYPGVYSGRGIVICAGGVRFNTCAWVTIRTLRHLKCDLPIEVWYRGDDERDPQWIQQAESLGVRCIDAFKVREKHPHPRLNGWELKPYAILHSAFREVLFLDADNVPVQDPTHLFDEWDYVVKRAIFWPDPPHIRTPRESERWRVFGVPYRNEPEVESGQLLIDKACCWEALNLCNWYNEHSDFFYQVVYGDKDTFRFAWHRCGLDYAMTEHALEEIPHTLCQKDFQGNRLFQHRFNVKWSLFENVRVPGFWNEELCRQFIEELREAWTPVEQLSGNATSEDRHDEMELTGKSLEYVQRGSTHWPLELGPRGYIGRGRNWQRSLWWVKDGRLILADGNGRVTHRLRPASGEIWEGTLPGQPRVMVQALLLPGRSDTCFV